MSNIVEEKWIKYQPLARFIKNIYTFSELSYGNKAYISAKKAPPRTRTRLS